MSSFAAAVLDGVVLREDAFFDCSSLCCAGLQEMYQLRWFELECGSDPAPS